jgi:hypothetical protein
MSDPLKEVLSKDTDHAAAHESANEVAKLLKSKVQSNDRIVVDEPCYPCKVPIHTDEFYCFVSVSDASFRFSAKRRPKKGPVADFFVSLKFPSPHMFAKTRATEASTTLGVEVFRQPFCSDEEIALTVLSKRMCELFRKIDFKQVSQFQLSPEQLSVAFSCQSAEVCARQALAFRYLVTAAFQEAYERSKKSKS